MTRQYRVVTGRMSDEFDDIVIQGYVKLRKKKVTAVSCTVTLYSANDVHVHIL